MDINHYRRPSVMTKKTSYFGIAAAVCCVSGLVHANTTLRSESTADTPYSLQIREEGEDIIVEMVGTSRNELRMSDFFVNTTDETRFLETLNQRLAVKQQQRDEATTSKALVSETPLLLRDSEAGFLEAPQHSDSLTLNTRSSQVQTTMTATTLQGASRTTSPSANLVSGQSGNYVVMRAISGAPLLKSLDVPAADLFKPANIVRYLGAGEQVAVFDNTPRWVETEAGGIDGKNIFVWAMGGGISQIPGYVPLFFLASSNPSSANGSVELDLPYNLLSRLAVESIQQTFYKNCYELHPETGDVNFKNNSVPANENYYCGQYPFGNTAMQTVIHDDYFRYVTSVQRTMDEIDFQPNGPFSYPRFQVHDEDPEGTVFDPNNPLLYLNVPIYVSNHQLRSTTPKELTVFSDDTASGVDSASARSYSFGHAETEENARVHPMDIAIRHYYTDDNADSNAVTVEVDLNLPGFEICNPWTQKEIVLQYQGLLGASYEARTSQFTLGCVSIGSLPLRIVAEIALTTPPADLGGVISNDGVQLQKGIRFKSVSFTQTPSISISAPVGLKFSKNDYPKPIQAVVESLLVALNGLMQIDGGNGSTLVGVMLWEHISNDVADVLLTQLEVLGDNLSSHMDHPREQVFSACNRLFPTAYQNISHAFYPLYKLCRTSALSLSMPTFINPPNEEINLFDSLREISDNVFAPVNMGGIPWASPTTTSKSYFCADGSFNCLVQYDRPWFSLFDPRYTLTGADKSNPSHYSYSKGSGVSIGMRATGSVPKPLWNLMRCLTPAANRSVAYHPHGTIAFHRQELQSSCQTEAVGAMCQLYGSAPALLDMWTAKYGVAPALGGYANYCDWYEELLDTDDTPDWQGAISTK